MGQEIQLYLQENRGEYLGYLLDHIRLSGLAILLAIVIGLPLGYFCYKKAVVFHVASFTTQVLRIIPSLAVLFILIPFIGVGFLPALLALFILGLSLIVLNTAQGFLEVKDQVLETARGLGMDNRQIFWKILLPQAFPYILTGIKLALVEIIASASLATYIGAGGLGSLIFTGLGLYRMDLVVLGGGSVALLPFFTNLLLDLVIKQSTH